MSAVRALFNILLGVFTEGWPGLKTENLGLIKKKIGAIDWHAPFDLAEARTQLLNLLNNVLIPQGLKLDAVVFGLEGESYSPNPAMARSTVGFAAPGKERRSARFRYTKDLVNLVAEIIPKEYFVRGRVTLKGHFGAFDINAVEEYQHLLNCLKILRNTTLQKHNALMLAETGCESAEDVIALIQEIGTEYFGANWDTANLTLWGVKFDTFEYARKLAKAGVLRGIHIKGGQAPSEDDKWGTEIDPSEDLIAKVIEIIASCPCFDGAIIIEREKFLGEQRETQEEKAVGLDATLGIVEAKLAA